MQQCFRAAALALAMLVLAQPALAILGIGPLLGRARPADGAIPGSFDVLFLGTGVSTGVPKIGCIVRPDPSQEVCTVCHDALRANSRNRRGNVSILVRYWHPDGRARHIMVDAGKTMREQCLRVLPRHNVRSLDALLLTHAHADAIHGLDDLRDFQEQAIPGKSAPLAVSWLPPLPVYATPTTFKEIERRFGYLVPGAGSALEKDTKGRTATHVERAVGGAASTRGSATQRDVALGEQVPTNVRTVSKLDWREIPEAPVGPAASAAGVGGGAVGSGGEFAPLRMRECDGLVVTPLPVLHGDVCVCVCVCVGGWVCVWVCGCV